MCLIVFRCLNRWSEKKHKFCELFHRTKISSICYCLNGLINFFQAISIALKYVFFSSYCKRREIFLRIFVEESDLS